MEQNDQEFKDGDGETPSSSLNCLPILMAIDDWLKTLFFPRA